MYMKNKHYIKSTILIFISLFLSNCLFGNEITNKYNTYKSSGTKILLTESWNVKLNNSSDSKIVDIPFFLTDKDVDAVKFGKSFSIPEGLSYTKARLWILGLHGNVLIYLNGQLIKKHVNSSTSYFLDLDKKLLKWKNNFLEIKLSKFDVSGNTFDFRYPKYPKQFRPIGVAREVYLEFFPEKYLDNIKVKYRENKLYLNYDLYIADISTTKNNKTVKIEEEITAPSGTIIHKRFEYLNNRNLKKSFKRELNIKYPSE